MAGGVALGFSRTCCSTSLCRRMDRYSSEAEQIRGQRIKLAGKRLIPNVFTYSLLMVMTYAALVQSGWVKEPTTTNSPNTLRQAAEEAPVIR
jgi:hypothetical protein